MSKQNDFMDKLRDALNNCLKTGGKKNEIIILKTALGNRIKNIIIGEKEILGIFQHKVRHKFVLVYEEKKCVPILISYKETPHKKFEPALEAFIEIYLRKIVEEHDQNIIRNFTNDNLKEQNNYIKKGFGFFLSNKYFKEQIKTERDDIFNKTVSDDKINYYGKEYLISEMQTSNNFYDAEIANLGLDAVIDFKNIIKLQKKAFYWIPKEKYLGKKIDVKNSVYLSYFYTFLRKNSFATYTDIAKETKSQITGPSRDWIPKHHKLKEPFLTDMEGIMTPVFFSKNSRKKFGLYTSKIRCYCGSYENDEYKDIKNKKDLFWQIYKFLINENTQEIIHDMMMINKKIHLSSDDLSVELILTVNKDIDLHLRKAPYNIIYVTCEVGDVK